MDTPPPFSPPKRWQFSLKSLMITMTVLAILFGANSTLLGRELTGFFIFKGLPITLTLFLATIALVHTESASRVLYAAAAIGAWHSSTEKFFDVIGNTIPHEIPEVLVLLVVGLPLAAAYCGFVALLFAGVAYLALKFARNNGWSRF